MDIADVRVDTRITVLRPLHAKSIKKSYDFFKTETGKKIITNGWVGAGIVKAVKDCRDPSFDTILDPFANLSIV